MEILKDIALVLNKKNVNEDNVSVMLFTKNQGKINAIAYRVRNSRKKEKISLNALSYINVEIKKINDNYIIENYNMYKYFIKIYGNINKLSLAFYILESLKKVLTYQVLEERLYERVEKALIYLENLEDDKLKDEKFRNRFLVSFLKKLIYELGIYDENITLYDDSQKNLLILEKYINNYFNTDISYDENMLGV